MAQYTLLDRVYTRFAWNWYWNWFAIVRMQWVRPWVPLWWEKPVRRIRNHCGILWHLWHLKTVRVTREKMSVQKRVATSCHQLFSQSFCHLLSRHVETLENKVETKDALHMFTVHERLFFIFFKGVSHDFYTKTTSFATVLQRCARLRIPSSWLPLRRCMVCEEYSK